MPDGFWVVLTVRFLAPMLVYSHCPSSLICLELWPAYASDFLSFVNSSPSPYHVVENAKALLSNAGFLELKERDSWAGKIEKGKMYFLTRNGGSIVAFGVGKEWRAGNGIAMIGAHTDSPTLRYVHVSCCLVEGDANGCGRLKPVSKKWSDGYLQVGVELYGGGLWYLFD
ncbi:aminopeptidase I zinc metalloprotease-domain-containing protein [Lipomyces starkeyi]